MNPRLFTDADIRARLTPELAVDVMLRVLATHGRNGLCAPPRTQIPLHATGRHGSHAPGPVSSATGRPDFPALIATAGHTGTHYGYRTYDTVPTTGADQVVVAHHAGTGQVTAVAVGNTLGPRRTGAIGAAAAQLLLSKAHTSLPIQSGGSTQPVRIGVVGSGTQARNQLWALATLPEITEVSIYSPRPERRERLAAYARREFGLPARAVESARTAVAEAELVVLATSATEPVIESDWLAEDVVVNTLGAKSQETSEIPRDLLDGAFVVSDSPVQHLSDPGALVPRLSRRVGRGELVVPLGALAAGHVRAPESGRRVHLSCGLAGTEVALLAEFAARC